MEIILQYIKDYFSDLIYLTNEMSPYLLLGFFFAGLLHVLLKQKRIIRFLGKNNLRSVVNASLLGIPLPLCSCGVIPTAISFYKNGASKGSTVSFLISTPQTGVDSILATYSLLGLPFAIIRPIIAFVTGIVGGAFSNSVSNKGIENSQIELDEEKVGNPIKRIFQYAFVEFLEDIAKWLVIGLLIAALFSVVIPDDFFISYIKNDYLSMLIVLAASIPLYVCATGSIPIAAVLMLKGLSPGAALVFLMAGPATNAATITVISKVLGKKTLLTYLASIIGGAIVFGIAINLFFPESLFTKGIVANQHHHFIPVWLQYSSSIILFLLIMKAFISKKFIKNKNNPITNSEIHKTNIGMEYKTLIVKGMTCNHCKANVERNLSSIDGIDSVVANPNTNEVIIEGSNIDLNKIKTTVDGLGYEYNGEK